MSSFTKQQLPPPDQRWRRSPFLALPLTLLLLLWIGPAISPAALGAAPPAPADRPVLALQDDLELAGLVTAAETSLRIMAGRDQERVYHLCGRDYTLGQLRQGLERLLQVARQAADGEELTAWLAENVTFCRQSSPRWPLHAMLTGYYEPEVAASLERDQKFRYPLYAPPPDLVRIDGREGRLVDGELQPYWSRAEIEGGNLLAGHELVYLADPLQAFILHVQGSGRVRLPDGRVLPVLYAAKSGRQYRSIGRLLLDEGRLPPEEADLPGIISYLRQHPDQLERVLHHNESFIFFRLGEPETPGPLGSFGLPLTAGRSVAVDQARYPPGIPAYLAGIRPLTAANGELSGWRPFGRVVFNHDSGSAIRGPGRVDLFWGHGGYAETAAGLTRHPAEFFLLLP